MAMTINMNRDGADLTLVLEGRLDTTTAPQLESELLSLTIHIDRIGVREKEVRFTSKTLHLVEGKGCCLYHCRLFTRFCTWILTFSL